MKTLSYASLQNALTEWATTSEDIRLLLVVGSRAREAPAADKWSDLDLIVFSDSPQNHLNRTDWFGDIGFFFWDAEVGGDPEVFILYSNGLKVDILFWNIDRLASHKVFQKGVKILVDKDNRAHMLTGNLPKAPIPIKDEYDQTLYEFWYGVLYIAKQLWRGELWIAKHRDHSAKKQLLQMITWYSSENVDTWYDGRFITKWADKWILDALENTFGRYDVDDSWQALWASVGLFRQIAVEVGKRLDYPYLIHVDDYVTNMVRQLEQEAN